MNNKQIGTLLLGTAGLAAVISVATTQIAYAIVLAGFYAGNMGGEVPAGPQNVNLHWLVMMAVIVQAAFGLFYILRPSDKT
jgi:hypothetical protein